MFTLKSIYMTTQHTSRRTFIRKLSLLGGGIIWGGQIYCSPNKKDGTETNATINQSDYTISAVNSMVRVMPADNLPANNHIAIAMAGNEFECFQIVMRAKRDINNVTVTIDPLINAGNTLPAMQWFQVGYVQVNTFNGHPTPLAVANLQPGWYPDPLLERDNIALTTNWSHTMWCKVHAPTGTPPGIYTSTVNIQIGDKIEKIKVAVEVYAFSLPQRSSLPTLFPLSLDWVSQAYGHLEPAMKKKWLDYVADCRLSPTEMYVNPDGTNGALAVTAAEYQPYMDRMNGFALYPITTTWSDRDLDADALIARFERNRPYIDSIIAAGIAEKGNGVFYGFDECEPTHFDTMKKVFAHVKKVYPDIPIATTSMHVKSYEQMEALHIDILILHIFEDIYNNTFADKIRKEGRKVWAYISLQPYAPMPNWRIENAPVEARILLSAIACHERYDGFLYWSLTQYNKGTEKIPAVLKRNNAVLTDWSITTPTEEYKWLHGDGILLYPGTNGPIGSIRMESIREGLEDYEYYYLLAQKKGATAARSAAGILVRSAKEYERDPQQLYKIRAQIANAIA
jgi:hypothetical protein